MNLTGSRTINADVKTVWAALLDPDVLKDCVPGCTEMAGSAEEGFEAKVVQKVGPIKATFKGIVEISDRIEYQSLKISGEGKGGPAGFAKGGADVRLEGQGDSTVLNYDVEAKVGGKLAQLGSRVIDGFAAKMADQFFENFQNAIEKEPTGDTTDGAAASAPSSGDAPAAETDEPKKGWLSRIRGR